MTSSFEIRHQMTSTIPACTLNNVGGPNIRHQIALFNLKKNVNPFLLHYSLALLLPQTHNNVDEVFYHQERWFLLHLPQKEVDLLPWFKFFSVFTDCFLHISRGSNNNVVKLLHWHWTTVVTSSSGVNLDYNVKFLRNQSRPELRWGVVEGTQIRTRSRRWSRCSLAVVVLSRKGRSWRRRRRRIGNEVSLLLGVPFQCCEPVKVLGVVNQ